MSTLTYGHLAAAPHAGEPALRSVRSSWRSLLRLAVVLAGAFSGGVAAHFLLADPGAHARVVNAATGSAGAVVATLTAYLFVRRMHRTLSLADVLLAAALTLLPVVSAIAAVVPTIDATAVREFVQFTAALGAGVVASLGLIAAAATQYRRLGSTKSTDAIYVATLLVGTVVVAAAALLADWADLALAAHGGRPTTLSLVPLVAAVGVGTASVAFFRVSAPGRDPALKWLAVAAAIVVAAHLTNALAILSSSDTLSGGNLVHVAAWLALLVGGLRDFEWAHRRDAEDAVLDERRRLARELHDGLAQELAYITTESRRLAEHPGAEHLAEAAERALEESRAAIQALTRPSDEPLERTISIAAQSIGARAGIDVTVAVRPGLDVSAEVRQALLRILREAMCNAARHAHATTVRVSLDGPSPLVLAIADDGRGFDFDVPRRPDSLGLQSMHERAFNLGGHLSVESLPGQGTTVAMVLP